MDQNCAPQGVEFPKCTVISCPNYVEKALNPSQKEYVFFTFPQERAIARIWTQKCGVAAHHAVRNSKVCAEHFKPSDFSDGVLKAGAIPSENLGWMFGMPEVKVAQPPIAPKFELVQDAVNTNEMLTKRLEKVLEEQKPYKEKIEMYEKRIRSVKSEILRLNNLVAKMPRRKSGNEANLICKVFSQAQINMLVGKKKVVWSYDDLAMAFTLRHLGNRECYLYLKNTLNMPLPALSCVQRWVASNKP